MNDGRLILKKYCIDTRFLAGKHMELSLVCVLVVNHHGELVLSNAVGFFSLDPRMEAQQTFCSGIMLLEETFVQMSAHRSFLRNNHVGFECLCSTQQ